MGGACGTYVGDERLQWFDGKREERRWNGRHRSRWEGNIKVGFKERE